jgi:hypothetical protein
MWSLSVAALDDQILGDLHLVFAGGALVAAVARVARGAGQRGQARQSLEDAGLGALQQLELGQVLRGGVRQSERHARALDRVEARRDDLLVTERSRPRLAGGERLLVVRRIFQAQRGRSLARGLRRPGARRLRRRTLRGRGLRRRGLGLLLRWHRHTPLSSRVAL